jgi:hypothetical protein
VITPRIVLIENHVLYVVIFFALFVLSRIHFVNEEFVRIDNILTTYSTVVFKGIFILVFYVFAY